MKLFISTFALAIALAFTGTAFAGNATAAKNFSRCEKSGGIWNPAGEKCAEKPEQQQ